MGWDCSFHLVDPEAVSAGVERLLSDAGAPPEFLQAYPEQGSSLWAEARRRVLGDGAEDACQIACQLAVYLAAASLPHHAERGVALSFGFDPSPPRRIGCWVPDTCMHSPESMFAALVARRPELAGNFRTCFESNCDTGVFIPAEHVALALRAVEDHMRSVGASQRRRFVGLARVLRAASQQGLAYWEATDLGVAQTRPELLGPEPAPSKQQRALTREGSKGTSAPARAAKAPGETRLEALLASHSQGPALLRAMFEELSSESPAHSEVWRWLRSTGTKHASVCEGAAVLGEELKSEHPQRRQAAAAMLAKASKQAKAAVRAQLQAMAVEALTHEDTVVVRHALATELKQAALDRELFARLAGRLEDLRDDEQALLALLEWLRVALRRKWPKKLPLPDFGPFMFTLRENSSEKVRGRMHAMLRDLFERSRERQAPLVFAQLVEHLAAAEQLGPRDVEVLFPRYGSLDETMRARVRACLGAASPEQLERGLLVAVFELCCSAPELTEVCVGMLHHEDTGVRARALDAVKLNVPSSPVRARYFLGLIAAALARVERPAAAQELLDRVDEQLQKLAERDYAEEALALAPGQGASPVDAALVERLAYWRSNDDGAATDVIEQRYAATLERAVEHGLANGHAELCFVGDARANPSRLARGVVSHWSRDRNLSRKHLLWLAKAGHGPLVVEALRTSLSRRGVEDHFVDLILGIGANLENAGDCPSAIAVARLGFEHRRNPDFLYNEACAQLTSGELELAAKTLARAIALDPKQARDAQADKAFAAYLRHPLFVPLWRK